MIRTKDFLAITFVSLLFLASCAKEKSDQHPPVFSYDADATRFITSAEITADSTKLALNSLIVSLKDSSLWDKFIAIYPFTGGTAHSMSLNLKDPRDADDAYRLTFNGSPVFAATGALFPTKFDYADTHLKDSKLQYNDNSISYYSRTQNAVSGYDIGCSDQVAPYNQMTIYHNNNATDYFGLFRYAYKPASTVGLFMISATAEDIAWYENGQNTFDMNAAPKEGATGYPFLIGWCHNAASGGQRECAFATIGKGLTANEARAFYNIVKDFQVALNR